jgi:hypothetical protein
MVEVTRYITFTPTKVTIEPVKINIDTSTYSSISSKINIQKLSESLKNIVKLNTDAINKSIQSISTDKLNTKVTQSLEASLAKFGASMENVGKTLDNTIDQVALSKVDLSIVKLKNNITTATQGLGKKTSTITPTKIIEFINTATKEVDNATTNNIVIPTQTEIKTLEYTSNATLDAINKLTGNIKTTDDKLVIQSAIQTSKDAGTQAIQAVKDAAKTTTKQIKLQASDEIVKAIVDTVKMTNEQDKVILKTVIDMKLNATDKTKIEASKEYLESLQNRTDDAGQLMRTISSTYATNIQEIPTSITKQVSLSSTTPMMTTTKITVPSIVKYEYTNKNQGTKQAIELTEQQQKLLEKVKEQISKQSNTMKYEYDTDNRPENVLVVPGVIGVETESEEDTKIVGKIIFEELGKSVSGYGIGKDGYGTTVLKLESIGDYQIGTIIPSGATVQYKDDKKTVVETPKTTLSSQPTQQEIEQTIIKAAETTGVGEKTYLGIKGEDVVRYLTLSNEKQKAVQKAEEDRINRLSGGDSTAAIDNTPIKVTTTKVGTYATERTEHDKALLDPVIDTAVSIWDDLWGTTEQDAIDKGYYKRIYYKSQPKAGETAKVPETSSDGSITSKFLGTLSNAYYTTRFALVDATSKNEEDATKKKFEIMDKAGTTTEITTKGQKEIQNIVKTGKADYTDPVVLMLMNDATKEQINQLDIESKIGLMISPITTDKMKADGFTTKEFANQVSKETFNNVANNVSWTTVSETVKDFISPQSGLFGEDNKAADLLFFIATGGIGIEESLIKGTVGAASKTTKILSGATKTLTPEIKAAALYAIKDAKTAGSVIEDTLGQTLGELVLKSSQTGSITSVDVPGIMKWAATNENPGISKNTLNVIGKQNGYDAQKTATALNSIVGTASESADKNYANVITPTDVKNVIAQSMTASDNPVFEAKVLDAFNTMQEKSATKTKLTLVKETDTPTTKTTVTTVTNINVLPTIYVNQKDTKLLENAVIDGNQATKSIQINEKNANTVKKWLGKNDVYKVDGIGHVKVESISGNIVTVRLAEPAEVTSAAKKFTGEYLTENFMGAAKSSNIDNEIRDTLTALNEVRNKPTNTANTALDNKLTQKLKDLSAGVKDTDQYMMDFDVPGELDIVDSTRKITLGQTSWNQEDMSSWTRKKVGDVMEKEIATATAKGKTANFNITRVELMDMNIPTKVKSEIITKYGDKLKGEPVTQTVTTSAVITPTMETPTTQEIPTMTIGINTTNVAEGLESDLVKSKLFTSATKEQQTAIRKMIEMGNTGNAKVKLEIATDYAKEWNSINPTLQKMTTVTVDTKLANNVTTAINAADYDKVIDNIELISKGSSALADVGKALTYAPASIIEKLKLGRIPDDVVTEIANARKQNAIAELNKKGLGEIFSKFSNGESVTTEELNELFKNKGLVQGGMFKSIAENTITNKKIFDAKAEQLMFNGTADEKTAFRIEIEKEIQSCKKLGTCI